MSNKLKDALAKESNRTRNAKGAVSNRSTLDSCVDLFGNIGSMRARSDKEVINAFTAAFGEDPRKALKILFWARDVRGGAGERKVPRTLFNYLADRHSDAIARNIELLPEYGRWDDYFAFKGTKLWPLAKEVILKQFVEDLEAEYPSLLAKWMPSCNTSSAATRALAREFIKDLDVDEKSYRKALSELRAKLNIVETAMCAGEWDKIDFEKVPSRAAMIYRKAFGRHDVEGEKRYEKYLEKVEKGEATIKTDTLYPYDLFCKATGDGYHLNVGKYDKTIDLQWQNLPHYVEPFNGMVVADVSASMTSSGYYGGRNDSVRPIDVALSLALYVAERNEGPWKDNFMPFSARAKMVTIKGKDFYEKCSSLVSQMGYVGTTNIQSVFDLILNTAIKHKLDQEDMIEKLFIVSDMQFDSACSRNTNFEVARNKFHAAGYELPQLIFWNVNAYGKDQPITRDDNGTCLVSGASPAILKSALAVEVMTPVDMMDAVIESERYAAVK